MGSTETFSGWPRLVTLGEVPAPFGDTAAGLPGAAEATLVYNPGFRFDRHRTSAKLLAWWPDRLALLDADTGGALAGALALEAIGRVEWGTALLSTWLEVEGGGPSRPQVLRVDFNTTCRFLYDPLLSLMRQRRYAGAPPPGVPLDGLARADYRFASFAHLALVPGAAPLAWHLEPASWHARRPGTRWPGRERLPGFLLLLTQAELVLIQEGDGQRHGPYAATWTYLPLVRLADATLAPLAGDDRLELRLRLDDGAGVTAQATAASAPALRAFLARAHVPSAAA